MWFSRYVLTEVYQSLASSIYLNLLITGKNQLLTALPCWNGLTHSSSRTSPLSPPARTCLFYLKTLSSIFQIESGTHLLSHAVSSIVPSAAYVLTVVFGMGTGVSHKRITTGKLLCFLLWRNAQSPLRYHSESIDGLRHMLYTQNTSFCEQAHTAVFFVFRAFLESLTT